jgi:predicted RNase H-like nuclease (RuvC/YqgF family)
MPMYYSITHKVKEYLLKDVMISILSIKDLVQPILLMIHMDKGTSLEAANDLTKKAEALINNYTDHLHKVTETKIYEIETTHEKFEESSTKILTNITSIENEFSKLMNILRKAADIVKNQAELLQTKDDLITQKNNNIKRLEGMIEKRNKKIARLENEKNN